MGKTLIVVNGSSIGEMKIAKHFLPEAENIEIKGFKYPFEFDVRGPYKTKEDAIKPFRKYLGMNLDSFGRIALWHGNSVSDKLFVLFFSLYLDRPFYKIDLYQYADGLDVIRVGFPCLNLSSLIGKEVLVSETELHCLHKEAMDILGPGSGLYASNSNSELIEAKVEDYKGWFSEFLSNNNYSFPLNPLISKLLVSLKYNSIEFCEEIIRRLLKEGFLSAHNSLSGKPVFTFRHDYRNVIIQLSNR